MMVAITLFYIISIFAALSQTPNYATYDWACYKIYLYGHEKCLYM